MRRGPLLAAVGLVGLAALAFLAFLVVFATPMCACAEPHPGIVVDGTRTADGYDLRIAALEGDLARVRTYADLDVMRGEVGKLTHAEWRATRDGAPLAEADEVRVGDVLHVRAAEGEAVRVVDARCNCYVATWPPAAS